MKAVSLLYHDAIKNGDFDKSGFPGAGADLYKIDVEDLDEHFMAVSAGRTDNPSSVLEFLKDASEKKAMHGILPLFLTFDDGGVSAALYISDLLDKHGWIGHFFITTDYINSPRFVSDQQIRELWERGHVIGSHSSSHPERMSKCSWDTLNAEWQNSISRLSDILGVKVRAASVPGGYYSKKIAIAASACGIKALFTSEPIRRCYFVDECLVLGRYTIIRGMQPDVSRDFCVGRMSYQKFKQYSFWNIKKTAKIVGGRYYNSIRKNILKR